LSHRAWFFFSFYGAAIYNEDKARNPFTCVIDYSVVNFIGRFKQYNRFIHTLSVVRHIYWNNWTSRVQAEKTCNDIQVLS